MKRETKNKIKKGLTAVLAVGILAGAAAGGKALYDYSKEDLKTINPVFHVGGLDDNGEYVDTDQSLYSELFEAKGLNIELDFESDIKYNLFFYDEDMNYLCNTYNADGIGHSEDKKSLESDYDSGIFVSANYARIMITPKWTNVEIPEDKTEEDVKVVKWSNILTFTSQMEVKVFKNQEFDYKDLYECSISSTEEKEQYYLKEEKHVPGVSSFTINNDPTDSELDPNTYLIKTDKNFYKNKNNGIYLTYFEVGTHATKYVNINDYVKENNGKFTLNDFEDEYGEGGLGCFHLVTDWNSRFSLEIVE